MTWRAFCSERNTLQIRDKAKRDFALNSDTAGRPGIELACRTLADSLQERSMEQKSVFEGMLDQLMEK
jgi:hypothetical protein